MPYLWLQRCRNVKCENGRTDPPHQDNLDGDRSPELGDLHEEWRCRDSRVNDHGLHPVSSVHWLKKQNPLPIHDMSAWIFGVEREDGLTSAPQNMG